ncbi:MAG: DUF1146 domain-containing protein [Bacilli bacterium]|jgi:uncharacterized membrane protein YwzB|nr:DUF1146 domain-containing protein [Bacilli bacterium]
MELKVYLYVFFTFMSVFIFNGINFNLIMKKNKVIEAKLLVLSLSFALSYLLTNFVIDFIS